MLVILFTLEVTLILSSIENDGHVAGANSDMHRIYYRQGNGTEDA